MGRRGRPAKSNIKREPNGRASRIGSLERIEQAERDGRLAATHVALNQPHRRNSVDPSHTWNESAIGRFLLPRLAKDKETIPLLFDAAQRYFVMYNRWQKAKDVAAAYREGNGWHGGEPTQAETEDRERRVTILGGSLARIKAAGTVDGFTAAWSAVHDAVMFETDIPEVNHYAAFVVLRNMAIEMGLPIAQRPYIGGASFTHAPLIAHDLTAP